ncbi:Proton-dependent oligopeptide transporter family [Dillenia turbinata]|uniref:Proton-dependent oligopeptide transporter family n=1 Tax=Dillenia turbinata TaxID=194707 RepID=A0AAN8Z473_9MAGN
MEGEDKMKKSSRSSWWFSLCSSKSSSINISGASTANETPKKHGGWRSMPYILGNETFERLATFGLLANFMVYLQTQLHLELVSATNVVNVWSGVSNFAPLIGGYLSDAYVGRFRTIAFASFASFLGMLTLTLIAWIPRLHPPSCTPQQLQRDECTHLTGPQFGVLITALGLLSIGSGGIRPCSIPFGVDQFDPTTEKGRKGISSYFNWYYTTFTVVLLITSTLVVYIQNSVSWAVGFGIPTCLMLCSIVLFFLGTRVYVHVPPEGSVFSSIAQVLTAAYRKRRVKIPEADAIAEGVFYDPPLKESILLSKLPLTYHYRCLNKAAFKVHGDVNSDGVPTNRWRLCSIQQVEEVKCLIRVIPIWASGIISFTAMAQQLTFTISQALKMDRHMGPNFQIPAGSLIVISMLTIGVFVPFYDRVLVPMLRRTTGKEGGITLLQRMGIGIFFSVLSMVVAGLIEEKRRASAIWAGRPDGVAPLSVFWLAPQLMLMGFGEAFNIIGQIEFFNKEFPEHMRSIANSLISVSMAGSSYLSSILVSIVHEVTGSKTRPDWLTKDINEGRVDYFYYLIAGMGFLNFLYFLVCAQRYHYKGSGEIASFKDLELNSIKN